MLAASWVGTQETSQKIMETALSAGNCEKNTSASDILQAEESRPNTSNEWESSPNVTETRS